jgi:undecaprenyl-diphosphatase
MPDGGSDAAPETGPEGVIFLNPKAGRHHLHLEQLRKHFRRHRVQECSPEDLPSAVLDAARDGAAFIGVAGGDGSLRGAAGVLVGGSLPLLPVPAGTRNHFAHQLGIVDFEAAGRATSGTAVVVDVGSVNGHYFINNSAVGLYPEMVERREALQRKGRSKRFAQLVATWTQVRHGHRFDVIMDGTPYRAWLLFVGNGRYGDDIFELTERHSIVDGVLDVRLVRADRPLARTRVAIGLVLGRLHRSPLLVRRLCTQVTFDLGDREVDVALDGEVARLRSPLHYRSEPAGLPVLLPPHEPHERPRMLRGRDRERSTS